MVLENRAAALKILELSQGIGDRRPKLVYTLDTAGTPRYEVLVTSSIFDRGEIEAMLITATNEGTNFDVAAGVESSSIIARFH